MRSHGVDVVVLDDAEIKTMLTDWIEANPRRWNADIGEVN